MLGEFAESSGVIKLSYAAPPTSIFLCVKRVERVVEGNLDSCILGFLVKSEVGCGVG